MSKKNELVLKTYELLKTAGPYDIKIRTIEFPSFSFELNAFDFS